MFKNVEISALHINQFSIASLSVPAGHSYLHDVDLESNMSHRSTHHVHLVIRHVELKEVTVISYQDCLITGATTEVDWAAANVAETHYLLGKDLGKENN